VVLEEAELSGAGGSFCHLHTHTEFSMLDGAARIGELVAAAARDGQPALGITDHGNMYGILDFYKACRSAGIVPVLGMEAYMAGESRHDRPARRGKLDDTGGDVEGGDKLYYHLTLLAETDQGYRNLIKLSSAAYLEGYYYKPRVDWELLERYHTGLIATTGCLGGVVLQALRAGDEARATALAGRLQEIFGRESLFVELQDHGLAEQRRTNPMLVALARRIGAPLLATNDSHYVARSDAVAHDALLCVQTGATISDPNRFHFEGEEHYLKSAAEMRSLFAELPEACDNTLLVAERARVELELGTPKLPEFPVPEEFRRQTYDASAAAYLRHLTLSGARERYGDPLPEVVVARLDYELAVIEEMGFPAYFLVVWDLIRHARERGIRVGPGRGSAAGCCVAYCLRIVELDPIRYDLLFERFLNPGRKQMPDIDMDFDERYRGEMIRYAAERYGNDRVAQIVTFSTIKARAAVRDAARVLGLPYAVGDKVAKAMPPLVMGRDTPLWACLERSEAYEEGYKVAAGLREMYETDPDVRRVVDVARGLEGLRRQDGIHAAAVVISHEPLTEYLPIQRKPEPGALVDEAPIVTQYEMHGVEELGLLKMDFLGLRNLSVISRCLDLIEETTGERPDIDRLPLDDEATYALLRRGDSIGVFQLEGGPMRTLMRSLAPTTFDDLAALVALYRPGPMAANMHNDYADRKNGRKPVVFPHPDLEEILAESYGLMIYQEHLMRVAQRMAGYSLAEADNLRKACGKKIRSLIAAEREKFIEGCERTGYGRELGTQLFDLIEPFADYGFNKSHAYGYALVAYQTAWLKAHYPVQYLAALLTSVGDDKDKSAVYLAECRSLGITVLVPDVNRSRAEFTPLVEAEGGPGAIAFGLAAVRNVGVQLVEHIVTERERHGPYCDFYDFCRRVDPSVLNKRALESLIKAGAFDALGHPRQGLLLVYEQIVDRSLENRRKEAVGIVTLFGDLEPAASYDDSRVPIPPTEMAKAEKLAAEKEMLGLYLSDHPLAGLEAALRRVTEVRLGEWLESAEDGETRTVGGVVTGLSRRYTKKGDPMATFVLEDVDGTAEVLVFPKTMAAVGQLLEDDVVVVAKVRLDRRDEVPRLICLELSRPALVPEGSEVLRVRVPIQVATSDVLSRLREVLVTHPGRTPVLLEVESKVVRLPADLAVEIRPGLIGELSELLGARAVVAAG